MRDPAIVELERRVLELERRLAIIEDNKALKKKDERQ